MLRNEGVKFDCLPYVCFVLNGEGVTPHFGANFRVNSLLMYIIRPKYREENGRDVCSENIPGNRRMYDCKKTV